MTWLLPSFIRVQIGDTAGRWPSLWIPVFLLWPVWFVVLLAFLTALLAVSARNGSTAPAFRAAYELHLLACGFRGGRCDIHANGRELNLSIV